MQASKALFPQNQIAFAFMSESDVREPHGAISADDPLAAGESDGGLFPLVSIAAVVGAVVLALISSGAGEPLLLTVLATLAMLGTFFVFGFMAGHIRIGARVREDDFVKAVADSLSEGVLVTRHDGTPIYGNRNVERFLGRTRSGEPPGLDALFPSNAPAQAALFRLTRAADRREPWSEEVEVPVLHRGPMRLLRIASRPFAVPGHERELEAMVMWTIADVTEERAQQATAVFGLKAALARYDAAPLGLAAVDAAGILRQANPTLVRWLGLDRSTLAGGAIRLEDLVSPHGVEILAAAAIGDGQDSAGIDLDVTSASGRVVPMRFFVAPPAPETPGSGFLLTAVNREAEGADETDLGAAEIRFARFFQSAPFGIATIGPDGRIASANGAFARMMGGGATSIGEEAVNVLCGSGDADARVNVDSSLKTVLAGKTSVAPLEITVGPQKEFTRRVYMSPLARTKGAREVGVLYVIDATEQKALEAKFAQSSKMEAVGKLAGGIAHDFNNVLTAIIGFSDLLLQTHRPNDPAYKDIKNIQSSANRAAGLVAKLLAFSRRQTLQTEPLQLGDVLTDLGPLMKRSIGETIELKVSSGRDLWYVKADKTQLDQVILNLAFNARDAMPDGGTLSFRTRNVTERESQKLTHHGMPVGEYVLIEVEDTGSGMSPEVMAKIFEPFFTTKGVGKGTGLGLATVYGIVKQSGGFIYPESTLGEGTTFRVYLPRHVPESEDEIVAQKAAKKERPQDLTGSGRVLLVEDEDVVRSFAVRALKRQGYEVLEASTGVEALEVMANNEGRIDIVVSDVVMPEMDGPTLLKELRKRNPELKIIFVSGYPHEAFETSLDKDEQFAFLPKPFSLPQLAAKVKEQLAR